MGTMKAVEDRTARAFHPELLPGFVEQADLVEVPNVNGDLATQLISEAAGIGASDVHLAPHTDGFRLRIRLDGTVWDILHLRPELGRVVINQLKALADLDPIVRFNPRDAHASVDSPAGPINLRLAIAPSLQSETVTVRLLDAARLERSVQSLGFSEANLAKLYAWLEDMNGLFLTTGPTGSGKTTTLYALLQRLKAANRVILTLEDPVEYRVNGVTQIEIDELHHLQFADGLKALLRHDPDYLLLGEIRDGTTAQTAVSAAISGRVLLSTMHARDCVGAVTALRNWGLADHEIAESLSVVVTQRLVRKLCLECCERRDLTETELAWFGSMQAEPPAHLWSGRGCDACRSVGYKGRTGVFELWRVEEDDYAMILRHTDEHRLRGYLAEKGHKFLLNEALASLDQGVTTFEEVRRVAAGSVYQPHGAAAPH